MGKYVRPPKATDERETPDDLFAMLNAEFHFSLDAAASYSNTKCSKFFTTIEDGLSQSWGGEVVWLNPPYSQSGRWVEKAYTEASQGGATVVCLLPSATDTAWWHEYATKGEIWFLRGRVRFKHMPFNAPFPSAIVVFRPYLL